MTETKKSIHRFACVCFKGIFQTIEFCWRPSYAKRCQENAKERLLNSLLTFNFLAMAKQRKKFLLLDKKSMTVFAGSPPGSVLHRVPKATRSALQDGL